MALEKKVVIGAITVQEDGQVAVRRDTVILDNGVEVSRAYHRHVLAPGDKTSAEDARVKAVARAVWDAKTIADFEAKRQA